MDHQPDVQKQSLQEQHLRLQDQPNIVYIQDPQSYRSQNYSYFNEGQSNLTGNQTFPEQNANYGQFESHCSYVNQEHFSSSNSSTPIISNSFESGKIKNDPADFRKSELLPDHETNSGQKHQRNDARIQFATNNFQSVDLQGLNYQQASPFFLQNVGNHYQFNDILVPTYQSSGSSESSDESPVSNLSQHHYSSDSSGISNNQLEFPAPLPTNNQANQNFQQFQQKDFLDNYMALLQQETQVPRCDSSKSETADSTCSSLSSGSTESQSENENIVRLPVLVNPIINSNAPCNILHSYQPNLQNNLSSCSNQIQRNQNIEFVDQRNYINPSDQNALKCNNFTGIINPTNVTNGNINDINGIIQSNSQVNNLTLTLPDRQNKLQNFVASHQSVVQHLPSSDILDSSKFVIQNSKVNQQKIFNLVNVKSPLLVDKMNSPIQVGQMVKLNNNNGPEGFKENDYSGSINKKNENCGGYGICCSDENGNNSGTVVHSCASDAANPLGEVAENCTSHIQNTSDSTVINSNFIQSNLTIKPVKNESNSAMLLKETSDKSINQSVSDVNSSVVDLNNVYLVKNEEVGVIKSDCYEDSSTMPCPDANSGIKVVPVPVGWRRLLVDGSIIYLSPTNIALSSIEQVKMYLQTIGTCKCGLECPIKCDSVFNFNPKVISRPWDSSDSEQTRLCNHKRKAPDVGSSAVEADRNIKLSRKEGVPSKKKKKKHGSGSSGVSVSQLLAQRDRALAAASARWPAPSQVGNNSYQNVPNNQCQNIQVVRNQVQLRQNVYENNVQNSNSFKQETAPARTPDDKAAQFSCISVINNSVREGTVVNINGVNQLLSENHSVGQDFVKSPQINIASLPNQRQEVAQGVVGHPINYQCGQEFMQNAVMGPRPEGIMLASQGMIFPSNVMMQRPRSIPPWHQTRLALNKKPVPETPVYEKVPYFQQHMPPPALVFEENAASRKKHKTHSKVKKTSQEIPSNQPSFMENPSAYLAQQTALLHNTISRPNFNVSSEARSATVLPQNQNSASTSVGLTPGVVVNNSTLSLPSGVLVTSTKNGAFAVRPLMGPKVEQNNFTNTQVCTKSISEKVSADSVEGSSKTNSNTNRNLAEFNYTNTNANFMDSKNPCLFDEVSEKSSGGKQQMNEKVKIIQDYLEKSDSDSFSQNKFKQSEWIKSEPSALMDQSNSIDENPVTSSTEKAPTVGNRKIYSDFRPIQGGTVSTSNGSPQPLPSPSSSNVFRQEVSSPKSSDAISHGVASKNGQISSLNSSFPASSGVSFNSAREHEINSGQIKFENSSKNPAVAVSQQMQTLINSQLRSTSPECSDRFKVAKFNFSSGKTSNQNCQSNSDNQEVIKIQSVTSSLDLQKEIKTEKTENKGNRFVRTMASGHTVSSNTITSVQAGKTQTATVTVNNHSSTPPTTISFVNLAEQNVVNIPLTQKGNSKSPLEMVQNVVSSIQTSSAVIKNELPPNVTKNVFPTSTVLNNILTTTANVSTSILANSNSTPVIKTAPGSLQTGHILVSSNGQYLVASSGNVIPQTNLSNLKLNQTSPMPPMSASPVVTNVTGAVTQVLPAVGVAQQVLGQPTVLVNALPTPFVIQPGVMAVETGLGRLAVATGNVLQGGLIENNALRNSVRGVAPPGEKVKNKKGSKKRKNQVTSLVQMASPNNLILNQTFNQPNFAVSPGGNVQPLPALTLVQGKHGGPAQIVMNNQNNFNQFGAQPQQINLLQPVNLTSVPNFPSFQQFIVPGLGNMVMSTDGTTTILPDTNIGVQLQLQNVNGQNVLTPVQNASFINSQGILTAPTGMLIRAPNNQQKIIQNSSSPQFLSPNNNQFFVNQFQGQLSPLIASNLSPNQQLFTSSPPRQSPQEFIQIIPTSSAQNTTVVQQNTTIVQQQTTMVSNNQNVLNNSGKSNFILNNPNAEKPIELQIVRAQGQTPQTHLANPHIQPQQQQQQQQQQQRIPVQEKIDIGTQHSVSTQTSAGKKSTAVGVATNNTFCQTLNSNWNGSPPDTTTHSPVESESNYKRTQSPAADESPDNLPQAMVQYVSSSINESESEGETYFLPGIPKILKQSNNSSKNIVESSTFLQEAGVQIQIGSGYVSSGHMKSNIDECVVSSHSDVNVQDKHSESQSNITNYHEEKGRLVNVLLGDTRSDDLDDEGVTDLKEKLSEGDLVWGPVRGFPAWPGKLVGPIGPGGKALVRWFGGHSSPTRVNVSQLQSLSQGLDAHHRASNKGRKNRRLNIELEAAIQEAMLELDKMTAQPKKISSSVSGRPRRSHR